MLQPTQYNRLFVSRNVHDFMRRSRVIELSILKVRL